uniref:Phospholipid/glycerol acyltransferase domain-containing protein n=1 Tax=viral metagenome TaxID=1070528 RepID=A0A6C0BE13_9ZZZZ
MDILLKSIGDTVLNVTDFILELSLDSIISRFISSDRIFKNIKYTDLEKISNIQNKQKGTILISNHSCNFDYAIVNKIIPCYCVAAIPEYIRNKIKDKKLFDMYKIICYDYSKESAEYVKDKILELISEGKNVLVFPEGSLVRIKSRDEELLKPFKKGLFRLAYDNNICILPISQYHYHNDNINYFDTHIPDMILEIPLIDSSIDNLNVDVQVLNLIDPSEKDFEEFYSLCFKSVYENLNNFKV